MTEHIEHIAFTGLEESALQLRLFIAEVSRVKRSHGHQGLVVEDRDRWIYDGRWIDLLPSTVLDRLVGEDSWDLEDLLDCLLSGEYDLLDVEYVEGHGRLLYDPDAFPFGGTDPLKATVEAFGLCVVGDSFWDGFAAWSAGQARLP